MFSLVYPKLQVVAHITLCCVNYYLYHDFNKSVRFRKWEPLKLVVIQSCVNGQIGYVNSRFYKGIVFACN